MEKAEDVALSLADRVRFRKLIREGNWEQAIEILQNVPKIWSWVERVFLVDPSGVLRADTPALPGVRGKNFAFRDWYKQVSSGWRPYISNVYTRTAEPRHNVVAVAVPIRADGGEVLGILVLQVPLNTLMRLNPALESDDEGLIYVTDAKGRLAAHPDFDLDKQLVDFSTVPSVEHSLRGERGVLVSYNPVTKANVLVAYEPLSPYGWAVVFQEDPESAFGPRTATVTAGLTLSGVILVSALALAHGLVLLTEKVHKKEKQLVLAQAESEQMEMFAFAATHDLQEPLHKVITLCDLLKHQTAEKRRDNQPEILQRVQESAHRLRAMMVQLRELARISSGGNEFEAVDLNHTVQAVLADLQPRVLQTQARIDRDDLPTVAADRSQMQQLFLHLIDNALKFHQPDEPPDIKITCRPIKADGKRYWRITVQDRGVGFDEKHRDRLFKPFQRLHTRQVYPGNGIGLAICSRIATRHGGSISVQSPPGEGCTVILTIPDRKITLK